MTGLTTTFHWIALALGLGLVLAACAPAVSPASTPTSAPAPTDPASEPTHTAPPEATAAEARGINVDNPDCGDPFEGESVPFLASYWEKTNFCLHSVPLSEIRPGGPPPDGIPAIDDPQFENVAAADDWLGESWPVMLFEWNGDARAYPLAILMWHEIVNDVVGGKPVTVTFCPLCNATIVFDRELADGTVLDFGTSGNLRNSDLVMYDRLTESWWQQLTGEAIVGSYTGTQLAFLPSQIIAWDDFKTQFPDGQVLSRETGFRRSYGQNPYRGYDSIDNSPFLFSGPTDDRLRAMERVVAINLDGSDVAYPFSRLSEVLVANHDLAGTPVVVFWKGGTTSALDAADFSSSRDVGSTAVYVREVNGQLLTFEALGDGLYQDVETGSRWNFFGEAIEGQLEGTELETVVSAEHFWFAWAAFKPDTVIWSPE